jgi:hypothetical protein
MPTKIIRNGEGYELVSLSHDEKLKLLKDLAKDHMACFDRCLVQAEDAMQTRGYMNEGAVIQVACAFFDKMATASFTVLSEALQEKTHSIKNGGH